MKKKSKKQIKEELEVSREGLDERFKGVLLEDVNFKKYRSIVKFIQKEHDLDEIEKEARRLHSGRKSRSLSGTTPGPQTLVEAMLQDSSNRSRLTQIRVELTKQEGVLDETIDTMRTHMVMRYSELIPDARTKAERMAYLNQYLRKGVSMRQRMITMITIMDLYIKDIDQCSFTLHNSAKVLELVYSKNNDRG